MAYDGGYIVIGTIQPEGTPYHRAYALHVDDNGSKLWEQAYSDPGSEADAIYPIADGYILACHTGGNIDLYRFNLSGTVIRHNTIEGPGDREVAAVTGTSGGGYVLVGDETGAGGAKTGFLMKVDAENQLEWNRTVAGNNRTSLRDMSSVGDSYYCYGTEGGRFWLVYIGHMKDPNLPSGGFCCPMLILPVIALSLVAIRRRLR
jgi:hypothetical protein